MSAAIQRRCPDTAIATAGMVPRGASSPDRRPVWMTARNAATAPTAPSGSVSSRNPGQSGISGWRALRARP